MLTTILAISKASQATKSSAMVSAFPAESLLGHELTSFQPGIFFVT